MMYSVSAHFVFSAVKLTSTQSLNSPTTLQSDSTMWTENTPIVTMASNTNEVETPTERQMQTQTKGFGTIPSSESPVTKNYPVFSQRTADLDTTLNPTPSGFATYFSNSKDDYSTTEKYVSETSRQNSIYKNTTVDTNLLTTNDENTFTLSANSNNMDIFTESADVSTLHADKHLLAMSRSEASTDLTVTPVRFNNIFLKES